MKTINLQSKTNALKGSAEIYWYENENVGLNRTLFHKMIIPLKPFDSGFDYYEQPLETAILIDWINFKLSDPTNLDGVSITSSDNAEVTIYVDGVYNICDIKYLKLSRISGDLYTIE